MGDMCFWTEVVYFCSHWQGVSRFVQYADVYCQTVVMQSAATGGVGDVDVLGGAFHHVPHLLLYTHRAGGIIYNEAIRRVMFLQLLLCLQ